MVQNYYKSSPSPWLIWGAAEFFTLFQFLIQLTGGIIIEPLMQDFTINAVSASFIISGFYYMYISLQVPVGIITDKVGPRRLLSWGAFVCGLACILFSQTHYFYLAFFARLCMGGGAAFAFVGTLNLIREWFPTERYAFLVGMSEMLGMIWAVCGTLVFATLLHTFGWRTCMLWCGFFFLLSGILSGLFIRNQNPARKSIKFEGLSLTLWKRLRLVARSSLAWKNSIYSGLTFSVVTVFVALWGPIFLQNSLHVSLSKAATINSMAFIGIALGCPLYGFISQKCKKRRPLLIFSSVSSALFFSIIIYYPHLSAFTMGALMLLVGASCCGYILCFAIADEISHNKVKSTYTGFTNAICTITAPMLQPIIGYILDLGASQHGHYTHSDFQLGLSVVLVALLASAGIAWFMPETFVDSCQKPID